MIDSNTLLAVFVACIGFLVFVYKQISAAGLRAKLLKLNVRRKHCFRNDSLSDCLQNTRNQRLLSSLFYRVNLIDVYVKKVIPIVMFLSIVALIITFVLVDNKQNFRYKASTSIGVTQMLSESGEASILAKGNAIYRTDEGEYIEFNVGQTGLFSFNENYVMRVGFVLFLALLSIAMIIFLAVAYFKNQTSIDDVQRSIAEDIRFLKDELNSVSNVLNERETKTSECYKKERLIALQNKMKHLQESLNEINEIEKEIAKISS